MDVRAPIELANCVNIIYELYEMIFIPIRVHHARIYFSINLRGLSYHDGHADTVC